MTRGPDRHLPRDVAWKVAHDPIAQAALAHEANILARLEHPSIVPVYDLVDDAVSLRMALRVVRGRTLSEAIAAGGRERLVRHVLHATEAVAWAHRQGVVHRDLKPANIMIGELGETQVIDWGLAIDGEGAPGQVVGTPRAMSPEQARGERVDAKSDVWSLGATLFEVVTGRSIWGARDGDAIMHELVHDRVPAIDDETRPELMAICRRALAVEPAARYPDARALAADLLAWLEGRRVDAHNYGALALARRFVRRFWLALSIVIVAATVLIVVLLGDYLRVREERDRARAAEAERAHVIATSSVAEARRELDAQQRPEALAAARRALAIDATPDARGVVAALRRGVTFAREARWPASSCVDVSFGPEGRELLCGTRDTLSLWVDGREQWQRAFVSVGATLTEAGRVVVVSLGDDRVQRLDARDGRPIGAPIASCGPVVHGGEGAAFALEHRPDCLAIIGADLVRVKPCLDRYIAAAAVDRRGRWTVLCRDGALVRGHATTITSRVPTSLANADGQWLALGVSDTRVDVLAGSTLGEVARIADDGRVVARRRLVPGTLVRGISRVDDQALVSLEGAGPDLVDARSLVSSGRMPRDESGPSVLIAGGVVSWSDRFTRWRIEDGAPDLIEGLGGITGLATSRDALAVTHDSSVVVLDPDDGQVLHTVSWSGPIAKAAAFDRGGGLELGLAAPVPLGLDGVHEHVLTRRLVRLADGRVVTAGTDRTLRLDDVPFGPVATLIDLAGSADEVAALTPDGTVVHYRVDAEPIPLATCRVGSASALALDGEAFLAQPEGVVAWDLTRCAITAVHVAPRADLTRVAISRGWLAAGSRTGDVLLWRRGETALHARVDAHLQGVTALAFDPDERWLVSGAWDGRVRFVSLYDRSSTRSSAPSTSSTRP